MHAFELGDLQAQRRASGALYHEFLRVPALSGGLYELPAGAPDPQKPHTEDEVYVVMSGRGRFTAAGEDTGVAAGTVLYVPAGVEHRFHTIEEDLSIVVLFAPAEIDEET
jgi:mannose-6-phosphate isomerase-like protein (cupin superfamily)